MSSTVTRGHGVLEPFLAKLRARKANSLIPEASRGGSILDVGCGSYPFFLTGTRFAERCGVDKLVDPAGALNGTEGISLQRFDACAESRLPFDDCRFDVVTMLAVFEHIPVPRLIPLITDVHRVLKPGGSYVMTTPSGWTGPVLFALKTARLVSKEEIDEHEDSYSAKKIRAIMERTPFRAGDVRTGYFEVGMNIWMVATKAPKG